MLKLIIDKEIRDTIKTTKFAVTFCICSALILLSFIIGARNYKVAQIRYNAAVIENLRKLDGITDWMMVRQLHIYLPPQPIEALVNGVSNDIGRNIEVRSRGELRAEDSLYGDEPLFAIFRFMDLDFVFTLVLSIFAILFAYDSINGEKERGTLALTFSYSVPKDKYISGKIIGSLLSLVVPLLIPIALGAGLLPVFGVALSGQEWLKLIFVIGAGILLISCFLTLSIFISTITKKSSHSFLLLLVIWIFAVTIIPRVSVMTAGTIMPVSKIDEINSQKTKLQIQLWNEDRKSLANYQPPPSSSMQDMVNNFNKFMQERADNREKKMQELSDRLTETRNNQLHSMQNLAFTLARFSPTAVFTLASQELAGTSMRLEDQFRNNALAYRKQYADFMKAKTGLNLGGYMVAFRNGDEKAKSINPKELPEYKYTASMFSQNLASALPDLGILILFIIAFYTGAVFSFRKFDTR